MTSLSGVAARLRKRLRGTVERGAPLAPLTTYGVGGPADLLLTPMDLEDLAQAVRLLGEAGVPWMVLGGGSNVLVSDAGVRGAVVLTAGLDRLEVRGPKITAEAGVESHATAAAALGAGLTGAEFLTRLPGSIGGACLMNARAYGGEISMVLRQAVVIDAGGQRRELTFSPDQFAYKRSPFQGSGDTVGRVTLALSAGDPEVIAGRMADIERARRDSHELELPSCGCVFKNDRRIGIPSGKLIDDCGLKDYHVGAARVSPHHGNFVEKRGAATASQIRQVIEHVRETVARKTGHRLELEVRLVGQWTDDETRTATEG